MPNNKRRAIGLALAVTVLVMVIVPELFVDYWAVEGGQNISSYFAISAAVWLAMSLVAGIIAWTKLPAVAMEGATCLAGLGFVAMTVISFFERSEPSYSGPQAMLAIIALAMIGNIASMFLVMVLSMSPENDQLASGNSCG